MEFWNADETARDTMLGSGPSLKLDEVAYRKGFRASAQTPHFLGSLARVRPVWLPDARCPLVREATR